MLVARSQAWSLSSGTALETMISAEASHPLSTLEAKGTTGLFGGSGQSVSFSPVCGEYQFQNCPEASWRSRPATDVSV